MYFRTLGEIGVADGDAVVPVTGVRRRRVLARLLAQPNAVVSRDQLVDAAWPGEPPPSAVNSLQSHVSRLRQTLGPDRLLHAAGGYRLVVGAEELDADRFQRLVGAARDALAAGRARQAVDRFREALALWGEPFAECGSEPFALSRVAELDELRLGAVEDLVQARLDLGEHVRLCAELEPLTALHPTRERFWQQRMVALYRSGRQADALAAYATVRRVLTDELGVEPGAELARVHDAVLNQRPALDWRPPAPTAPGVPAVPLLERDAELSALDQVVSGACAGRGSLLLLEGPAGCGKSALLAEAARRGAGRDVRVLSARAQPLERSFAFGFVRQLLEPAVREGDPTRLFAGPAAPARVVFHPPAGSAGSEEPLAVIDGLYQLVVGLAETRPLLLLADDVQLADEPSQRLLAYLHPRVHRTRAGLVVASRPASEVSVDAPALVPLLVDRAVRRLRPRALTREATDALVATTLGDHEDAVGATLHRLTGGNPLFVSQVLSELRERRPTPAGADVVAHLARESVGRIVLERLALLPDDCRRVARVLAVLGDGSRPDLVARAADLSADRTAAAARRLVHAAVLGRDPELSFEHPIMRDAVYADLGPTLAAEEHLRVARVLRDSGADDEQVALHLVRTHGGGRWVAEVLGRTGRAALAAGAPLVAVEHLCRALAEAPPGQRPELLVTLGQAQTTLGEPDAVRTLETALETAVEPDSVLAAGLALSPAYAMRGQPAEAIAVYERARVRLADHPELAMSVDLTAAVVEILMLPPVVLAPRMARLESGYASVPDHLLGQASAVLAQYAAVVDGDLELAVQRAHLASVRGAGAAADEAWDCAGTLAFLAAGRYDDALAVLDRVLTKYPHHRVKRTIAHLVRAWAGLHRGRLRDSAADAREMAREFGREGPALPFSSAMLAEIHGELGAEDEAARYAAEALTAEPTERPVLDFVELRVGRMWLALDRPDRALDLLEAAHRHQQSRGLPATALESAPPWLAIARHRCGHGGAALGPARTGVVRADRVGSFRARGIARTALAEVTGDHRTAATAVGLLRRTDSPLELARALLVRSDLASDPAEARRCLDEALDLAIEHGYVAVAGAVSDRLGRSHQRRA